MEKGISMIMPAYNAEKYLDLSIGSVLAQTYKEFELIIVDDGSKDNTWEICKRYAEKDCRVKAFHKENEGVSLARNYALDKVGKEYVMFIDADDYIDSYIYAEGILKSPRKVMTAWYLVFTI
jgi:glycosyltransferase involved in cell wall biosynthesis